MLGSALLRVWAGPGGPPPTADNLPESTMDVTGLRPRILHNGSVPTSNGVAPMQIEAKADSASEAAASMKTILATSPTASVRRARLTSL